MTGIVDEAQPVVFGQSEGKLVVASENVLVQPAAIESNPGGHWSYLLPCPGNLWGDAPLSSDRDRDFLRESSERVLSVPDGLEAFSRTPPSAFHPATFTLDS
ncbi:MAG TPA: hypothetical protein VKB88_19900 [Bryobacteraceae bacterium]|nr:hypothetical protein [Bryobacteraceae bacterium]